MTIEPFEIEGAALALYRQAGLDPSSSPSPGQLAMALPDIDVEFVLRASQPAMIRSFRGRATIRILATATPSAQAWFLAHELGEWVLRGMRVQHEAIEHFADAVGAAIIAPRPAVLAMRTRFDDDLERTARAMRITQTVAALRWGEVFGRPVAIVERHRVKARGAFDAPDRELRRIAAAGGGAGMRALPITDTRGRVVLLGDW